MKTIIAGSRDITDYSVVEVEYAALLPSTVASSNS